MDLKLQKQPEAPEQGRSKYVTAVLGRSEHVPLHSGFRGPPANTSKHGANLSSFYPGEQIVQIVCPLESVE